jgi:hypothetical protein
VHLSQLTPQEALDLLVLAGLVQRLDPERDRLDPARGVELARGLADRGHRLAVAELVELGVERRPQRFPGGLEAREVEVALRAEVAVQDRLGDAGLAGDLGGRGAAVAADHEDALSSRDDRLPALRRRQASSL